MEGRWKDSPTDFGEERAWTRESEEDDRLFHLSPSLVGHVDSRAGSFDAVACSLSFEYLIRPAEVVAGISRVLSPGGVLLFGLSDRWFPPKVTRIWTRLHEFERVGFVLEHLYGEGSFGDFETPSVRGWPRPLDGRYYGRVRLSRFRLCDVGREKQLNPRHGSPFHVEPVLPRRDSCYIQDERSAMPVMRGTGNTYETTLASAFRFVATALALLLPLPGIAAADDLLTGMKIEGNKRTKGDHIRYLTRDCLEDQGAESIAGIDVPELEQCLMNSELFTEAKVAAVETLTVTVRDRWTLIPLPFVRSQEDSTNVGGFVMDSNFLGRGQLIVLGATFGNLGDTYFAMLRDPSVAFTDWTARIIFIQDFGDIFRYEGDVKVDGYRQKERTLMLSPGRQFTTDLEGKIDLGYTQRDYEGVEEFTTRPEDYEFWTAGLSVELDAADYRFYFREGHRVEVQLRHQFARSGDGDPTLSGEFEWDWQHPFPGRNVFKLSFEGMAVDSDAAVDSFQLGGRKSLQGVQDKGLWAQYLAGALVEYHLPLREGRWGTWAAGPFASWAYYKPAEGGADGDWQDTLAYGLGLFYYLKKIAFPGVGIVAGRNEDFSGNFVTFQLGFGF